MKIFYRLIILALLPALTACATNGNPFKARDRQFLAAESIPPLRIPPGTSSSAFHNYYPVSDRQYPTRIKEVSLMPPGLYS